MRNASRLATPGGAKSYQLKEFPGVLKNKPGFWAGHHLQPHNPHRLGVQYNRPYICIVVYPISLWLFLTIAPGL